MIYLILGWRLKVEICAKRASLWSSLPFCTNVGFYYNKFDDTTGCPRFIRSGALFFFFSPFSFLLSSFLITLSFISVYGALLSCTYIIEVIYNNGVKDSFQFIKKANTERIMEETKWWEIERTKWKRKKRLTVTRGETIE